MGAAAFLIIGFFHPIIIRGEYYFGKKIRKLFSITGIILTVQGIAEFTCLWSIHNIPEQEQQVKVVGFPKSPKKKIKYTTKFKIAY
ncbi:MAG: DUF4491 family protein [Paludibacteraceae bacterium]